METTSASGSGLIRATLTGTVLQVLMVVTGHWVMAVQNLFGVLGTVLAVVTGFLFGKWSSRANRLGAATGGAIAGSVSSLLGTVVSYGLHDIPGNIIGVGTLTGIVAGAVGGVIGFRKPA